MADADVHRYLKLFTFEPLETLESLMEEHQKEPSKRVAQHKLAREVLEIVHGAKVAGETEKQHRSLYRKGSATIPMTLVEDGASPPEDKTQHINNAAPLSKHHHPEDAPFYSLVLPKSLVYDQPISRVLYHAGMVTSRSEAHRRIVQGSVYLGSRPSASGTMGDQLDFSPATNWVGSETQKYIIGGNVLILRVGKWNLKIIKIIPDEQFEAEGLTAPGWKEPKEEKPMTRDLTMMKSWHRKSYVKQAPLHQRGADKGEDGRDEKWNRPLNSYVQ